MLQGIAPRASATGYSHAETLHAIAAARDFSAGCGVIATDQRSVAVDITAQD